HRAKSSDRMHHRRSREIHVPVPPMHAHAELRKPTAAPSPAPRNRIQDPANKQLAKQKRPKRDPLANRANDDVSRRLHKHHFEQRQAITANVVRRTSQKKSLPSQKSPRAASNQKMIQRRCARQIPRRRI